MRLKIHKEGKKILLTLFAAMVLINVIAFQYVDSQVVFGLLLGVTSIAYVLISTFFRNPRRYGSMATTASRGVPMKMGVKITFHTSMEAVMASPPTMRATMARLRDFPC